MANDQIQFISWPGILGVESFSGTISHGIAPAAFILTTYPQTSAPAEFGDLTISDGFRTVTFRECKASVLTGSAGSDGQTYTLTILDRRWRWVGSAISGRYNQLDPRGKLIPWTIRSPQELAKLCLDEMGEVGYFVDLPPGIPRAAGANLDKFLALGENFPQSLANPPVVWDYTPPAIALNQLASIFGRRIVFQPINNRLMVVPPGVGGSLPDGPMEVQAPTIDAPERPILVGVGGAPMRIDMRLMLEAVGEEWDGSYLPINELSYAPVAAAGLPQISYILFALSGPTSTKVFITWRPPLGGPESRAEFSYSAGTMIEKMAQTAADINRHPELGKLINAVSDGVVSVTLYGKVDGWSFEVLCETSSGPPNYLEPRLQQAATLATGDWSACSPPNFQAVRATDRLSHNEAVGLARKSVYRCYRVVFADVATGKPPIKVPYYSVVVGGPIVRRQQLILQTTKVEQVEPEPRRAGGQNRGLPVNPAVVQQFGGIMPEFYNGYSRDQKSACYGSISKVIGSVLWDPSVAGLNTAATDKIYVEFSIDPIEQIVTFAEPIYQTKPVAGSNAVIKPAQPILETAVIVTDSETGEPYRWYGERKLGGRGRGEYVIRDDIQVGVVTEYTDDNNIRLTRLLDQGDADKRLQYYLDGMAAKYVLVGGETRQYPAIMPIDPDGMIQQVSYSLGTGGPTTVASTNSEHSDVIPPYPARQQRENFPPDKMAREANLAERQAMAAIIPKAAGDPRP